MKRIAIVTSGGDAPGMNACIRAVVRTAYRHGILTYGIRQGYDGLASGDLFELDRRAVGNIIQRGGTILGSARTDVLRDPGGRDRAIRHLRERDIDAMVVCGGDGSFRAASLLTDHWPEGCVVGVPATIDNDVYGTDTTIGFDTAVNTALEAIDRIRDTAEAQERVFLVEVMGRHCGAIALDVALAGGAIAALVPESPHDVQKLIAFLNSQRVAGRRSSIIVVAEGDEHGGAMALADELKPHVNAAMRVTVLGHIQRGGAPTAASRILGTRFGVAAVEALVDGATNVMVGLQRGEFVRVPFAEVVGKTKPADATLVDYILNLAG